MDEALSRAGWICVIAVAVAYVTYLFVGTFITQKETGSMSPVVVRDTVSKGEHHISGMVMVPQSCDELTLVVEKADETTYQLTFATWTEPSVKCIQESAPRVFDTVVFAPSIGIQFTAVLDGIPLPVAVYTTLAK